jgi:uncharacterized protein
VLLITGSGAQDRDETILSHKPFLIIADYLTRRGFPVLRVDDRGVGGTGGDVNSVTSNDFADDALSGVAYLKNRKDVDEKHIGLIGHSEGGIVAPIAAAKSTDVAFIVMLAGTGVPGRDIILRQQDDIAAATGVSAELRAFNKKTTREMLIILNNEPDNGVAETKIRSYWEKEKSLLDQKIVAELNAVEKQGLSFENGLRMMLTPWSRYFLTYDPAIALKKVACPVLAIIGEKDVQVAPDVNIPAIGQALKAGGNTTCTVKMLPGLNHLFQECETGALSEYARIEQTFSPIALACIGDWLMQQLRAK